MSVDTFRDPTTGEKLARKVVTYSCGCVRGLLGVPGREPRPPMTCPEHGGEFESGDTLDPVTGRRWRP